jgi:hypothetical protein
MRNFLFIAIVLVVYVAGNTYLYVRSWQALEMIGRYKLYYSMVFWTLALLFILANFIRIPASWMDGLHAVSSQWIAVMLHIRSLKVT